MDELYQPTYDFLKQIARSGTLTTYGDVAKQIGLVSNNLGHLNRVFDILDQINEQQAAGGRPLLGVLVVNKTKRIPGPGFFENARYLLRFNGTTPKERVEFFQQELSRTHDYWKDH
jgi:alkylated DNA nucleotide flippase Atl1